MKGLFPSLSDRPVQLVMQEIRRKERRARGFIILERSVSCDLELRPEGLKNMFTTLELRKARRFPLNQRG